MIATFPKKFGNADSGISAEGSIEKDAPTAIIGPAVSVAELSDKDKLNRFLIKFASTD